MRATRTPPTGTWFDEEPPPAPARPEDRAAMYHEVVQRFLDDEATLVDMLAMLDIADAGMRS